MALYRYRDTRRFKWTWQGHAQTMNFAEISLKHDNMRVCKRKAAETNAASRYMDTMLLSNTRQNPEKKV